MTSGAAHWEGSVQSWAESEPGIIVDGHGIGQWEAVARRVGDWTPHLHANLG